MLWITLNRPDALNALNAPMYDGLAVALEEAADPEVRAVVLTGAGRGFCAGQDVNELRGPTYGIADRIREHLNRTVLAIRGLEKPVIAAVNGPAAGAGLSLALACDVRLAADTAVFAPAFSGLGLAPDSGATWLAGRLLGPGRAFEWLTTGRELSARQALEWGLVSELVAGDELPARAAEVAELFAAMPTRAVWETKRLLDLAQTSTLEQQLESEALRPGRAGEDRRLRRGTGRVLRAARRGLHRDGEPDPPRADRRHRRPAPLAADDALPLGARAPAPRRRHRLGDPRGPRLARALAARPDPRPRRPPGLHAWMSRLVRYSTHVYAYAYLVADPFPGFRGWPGSYPIDVEIAGPVRQPRWSIALRLVLVIPASVFLNVLAVVLSSSAASAGSPPSRSVACREACAT